MEIHRLYETTIAEPEHGFAAHYIVIPPLSEMGSEGRNHLDLYSAAKYLDLELHGELGVSNIARFMWSILAYTPRPDGTIDIKDVVEYGEEVQEDLRRFAEFVAFGEVLALEGSDLAAHSLAAVAAKGGIVVGGSTLGLAAAGPTPLLLITVPLGIILVGAATGVAQALQHGLRSVILRRMGVDEPTEASVGAGF